MLISAAFWLLNATSGADEMPLTYAERLRTESIVLKAAEVHDGTGQVFKPGTVILLDGKIVAVGQDPGIPLSSRRIDLGAVTITPGLIDAACQLGTDRLYGWSEQSSEIIPHLQAADSVDYYSRDFERLAKEGVTTVFLTPEAASVISCQGIVLKTAGPIDRRRLESKPCVKGTIGPESFDRGSSNNAPGFGDPTFLNRRPTTRMGSVWVFRKAFYDALNFTETGKTKADPAAMNALKQVIEGRIGLRMQARVAHDIMTADRLTSEFGVPFILEYGNEVHRCLDVVASRKIPVIFGPLSIESSGVAANNDNDTRPCLSAPVKMQERGIEFALTASDFTGESGLARQAGLAVRFGLPLEDALRAVTSTPARLLTVDQRVGALKVGMDADLVAWSGTPFADTSKPVLVLIGGEVVHDPTGICVSH